LQRSSRWRVAAKRNRCSQSTRLRASRCALQQSQGGLSLLAPTCLSFANDSKQLKMFLKQLHFHHWLCLCFAIVVSLLCNCLCFAISSEKCLSFAICSAATEAALVQAGAAVSEAVRAGHAPAGALERLKRHDALLELRNELRLT
jgi:hypothetical protein